MRDILGVKEGEQACLFQPVAEAEQAGRVTYDDREDRLQGMHQRVRFVCGMPRNASHTSLRVHCIACWETVQGKVQPCSWITALRVNTGTGYRIMQGGRARWRIANEPCNTLQQQGDPFAPNVGHGYAHLAVVCAELMMLACLVEQVQPLC